MTPLDRHERVALSYSGGKDSTAVLYLLREHLHRITVYHMDTGDLLPEAEAVVEAVKPMCPHFVHIRGDVKAWHAEHGLPTDLFPHSAEPVGQQMAEGVKLTTRYHCCTRNIMTPLWEKIRDDGNTLLIRGTRRSDMKRLPMESGDVSPEGVELWYPIQEWKDAGVMSYLRAQGAPISRIYDYIMQSPECASCSAWWDISRARYLKQHHPAHAAEYARRLHIVASAIAGPFASLMSEMGELR